MQSFKFATPQLLHYFLQVISSSSHPGSLELKKKSLSQWIDRCLPEPIPDQLNQFPKVRSGLRTTAHAVLAGANVNPSELTLFPHFLGDSLSNGIK